MRYAQQLANTLLLLSLSGCALTSKAPDFNGLKDVEGSDAGPDDL